MEQRVRQYHEEALKGKTNKSLKNMNNFRKFIHKNQDYDFSDREKVKLFGVIEAYFTMFDRNPGDKVEMEKEDGDEGKKISSLGLIEDALKVPCFNTKQKQKMLKWYDELLRDDKDKKPVNDKNTTSTSNNKSKNKYYSDDEDMEGYEYDEDDS